MANRSFPPFSVRCEQFPGAKFCPITVKKQTKYREGRPDGPAWFV
ncbi:hypothetical protein HMPREF0262_00379 [Clostridium sp. ATCC 29733]|nr:hypothetical protein HMPREF0262_00379 [Clostridium sp. ATCC 29733]